MRRTRAVPPARSEVFELSADKKDQANVDLIAYCIWIIIVVVSWNQLSVERFQSGCLAWLVLAVFDLKLRRP